MRCLQADLYDIHDPAPLCNEPGLRVLTSDIDEVDCVYYLRKKIRQMDSVYIVRPHLAEVDGETLIQRTRKDKFT